MKARGKRFLNESIDEGGSIRWSVKTGEDSPYSGFIVDGDLKITDCDRQITIDLDCEEPHHIDNRIGKVDVLLEELNKIREILVQAKEEYKPKKFYY